MVELDSSPAWKRVDVRVLIDGLLRSCEHTARGGLAWDAGPHPHTNSRFSNSPCTPSLFTGGHRYARTCACLGRSRRSFGRVCVRRSPRRSRADPTPSEPAKSTASVDVEVKCVDDSTIKLKLLDDKLELVTKYGFLQVSVGDVRRIDFAPPLPARRYREDRRGHLQARPSRFPDAQSAPPPSSRPCANAPTPISSRPSRTTISR